MLEDKVIDHFDDIIMIKYQDEDHCNGFILEQLVEVAIIKLIEKKDLMFDIIKTIGWPKPVSQDTITNFIKLFQSIVSSNKYKFIVTEDNGKIYIEEVKA